LPRGLLTPYSGVALTGSGEIWRADARWRIGPSFDLALEASLREPANGDDTGSSVLPKGSRLWQGILPGRPDRPYRGFDPPEEGGSNGANSGAVDHGRNLNFNPARRSNLPGGGAETRPRRVHRTPISPVTPQAERYAGRPVVQSHRRTWDSANRPALA